MELQIKPRRMVTDNPSRRSFLKLMGLGSGALLLTLFLKKVADTLPGMSAGSVDGVAGKKVTSMGKEFIVTDGAREAVVYNKRGEALIIFEK